MARSIAVLKLSSKVKNVIAFAQSVANALTGNPSLPTPTPPLAKLQSDIAALAQAETATLSRMKGAFEVRNARLAVVRSYVQSVVDTAAPADALALIEGAGLAVREASLHDKPALAAKRGSLSGTVTLVAKAAASRAAYFWECSTDQKTWTEMRSTTQAKTVASGLLPGAVYFFRVQALTKSGEGDFSQVVSLLVT